MPNSPEMSRFLYTILKQLDLKSINWAQVSSELGITNGHAARMRYSRFKQQMEGTPPTRRTRNPAAKRAPKQKRPKEESKDLKVKTEGAASVHDPMGLDTPSLSPSLSMPSNSAYPDPVSMTPEAPSIPVLVKPEPSDDMTSSASSRTRPADLTSYSRSHSSMPSGMSSPLAEQLPGQSQNLTQPQHVQTMADFHFSLPQQQQMHHQQSQRMFEDMGRDLSRVGDLGVLIETGEHEHEREQDHDPQPELPSMPFLMDMYHPMGVTDMGVGVGVGVSCQGNLMSSAGMASMGIGPMVKVEERWDPSYAR